MDEQAKLFTVADLKEALKNTYKQAFIRGYGTACVYVEAVRDRTKDPILQGAADAIAIVLREIAGDVVEKLGTAEFDVTVGKAPTETTH